MCAGHLEQNYQQFGKAVITNWQYLDNHPTMMTTRMHQTKGKLSKSVRLVGLEYTCYTIGITIQDLHTLYINSVSKIALIQTNEDIISNIRIYKFSLFTEDF